MSTGYRHTPSNVRKREFQSIGKLNNIAPGLVERNYNLSVPMTSNRTSLSTTGRNLNDGIISLAGRDNKKLLSLSSASSLSSSASSLSSPSPSNTSVTSIINNNLSKPKNIVILLGVIILLLLLLFMGIRSTHNQIVGKLNTTDQQIKQMARSQELIFKAQQNQAEITQINSIRNDELRNGITQDMRQAILQSIASLPHFQPLALPAPAPQSPPSPLAIPTTTPPSLPPAPLSSQLTQQPPVQGYITPEEAMNINPEFTPKYATDKKSPTNYYQPPSLLSSLRPAYRTGTSSGAKPMSVYL